MQSSRIRDNYPEREKVYKDGLNVPLPSWASYRNSVLKPGTNEKITLRFLPRNDPRGMYLGVIASCCQHPDGEAGTCAVDGHLNPKAAFMVIEHNKEIIAEAYTWEDNTGNICLDTIETVGEKAFHSERTKQAIKQLIMEFGKAQEDCLVTCGNNILQIERSPITLENPTHYYIGYTDSLRYEDFYRDDHKDAQFLISDTRKVDYDQRTYNIDNPSKDSGEECPMCHEMSLEDGECSRCDYDEDYYTQCPACDNITFDSYGVCQARNCDFRLTECPMCHETEFDEDANRCRNCRFDRESAEECPKCGEDSLIDGDCLRDDCDYSTANYEPCPRCHEETYDYDDQTCFKCGYDADDDDEDDDEEEPVEIEDDDGDIVL